MQGSISIFKRIAPSLAASFAPLAFALALATHAHAAEEADPNAAQAPDKTLIPEEEDFSHTPFTEYGEFNEEAEEAADTKFFQYGRFFGVSLGTGYQGLTGHRGRLWSGGAPAMDFRVHYWFDFNVALDLGVFIAPHYYTSDASSASRVDVKMTRLGLNTKYYFDTKNLSAAISFANPHVLAGAGAYSKVESSPGIEADSESVFGLNFGAGLEFAIKPKKVYFQLDGKYHIVTFGDVSNSDFATSHQIPDLTGDFYTISGSLLFTW